MTHLWHGSYVDKELELDIEKELDIDIEIDDNEKISKITKCYEDNIGLITPAAAELIFSYLKDFKDYRIINEAIKTASIANIRTAKYINGILRSWLKKGYKVLADVQNEQNQKTEKKEEKPKEDYKEIDTSILTDEEYADIVRGKTTYEEIMKRKGVQNEWWRARKSDAVLLDIWARGLCARWNRFCIWKEQKNNKSNKWVKSREKGNIHNFLAKQNKCK